MTQLAQALSPLRQHMIDVQQVATKLLHEVVSPLDVLKLTH
ncbi:MAG: hypothetical protein ACI9LE_000771 [Paraglaciecola sp.]|jgi:hypothetical protein